MRLLISGALLTGLSAFAPLTLAAQEGSLDPTFSPSDIGYGNGDGVENDVLTTALQPDGKIIIGGGFGIYNGTARTCIARINPDGSLDASFNPGTGANSIIRTVALQSDAKIIVGGEFTSYNGTGRNHIARLNADGSLDATFDPGSGANNSINTMAIQPDGKIIIGGWFTSYNGAVRNYIARVNGNGALDATFNPGTGSDTEVLTTTLQPNGKIIIGGWFSSYNGTDRNRIARLNSNGSLDVSFNPGTGVNSSVETTALQPDGKIIIGGGFTTYNDIERIRIARLNADGSLDASFNPGSGASLPILTTTLQPDGKLIIGGQFNYYNGTVRYFIARINADGTLDSTFNPGAGANDRVLTAVLQTDGKVIIGGEFTNYNGTGRDHFVRLHANGNLDVTFNPGTGANDRILAMALQPDAKVIIGGQFTSYNDTGRSGIARLNSDGTLDASFNPGTGANYQVLTTTLQPDGKTIIGGYFTYYNGIGRNFIARVNVDGSLDASFNPGSGANSVIITTALQPNGKVLIGGSFTTYSGTGRSRIARVNPDGSLDASFNSGSGADGGVYAIALQPDGKLIIGGNFLSFNGTGRNRIARLNADGTLDPSFNPGAGVDNVINTMFLQADGKVIVGGSFTSYNGTGRNHIARVNTDGTLDNSFNPGTGANSFVSTSALQTDGKIIIGGQFTSYNGTGRNGIARLHSNGGLDASLNPGTGVDYQVLTTSLHSDGKIIIGGSFTSYNGTGRNRIARINGTPRAGIKLMLEGPYSGGTMTDALRTLPTFPLTEPFTALGYAESGYVSGATIGTSVLTTTGNNAIVDWVILEMRPASTPGTVAASRAVLLQRDGDVVDLDGVSNVGFAGLAAGNYCVAVKPRNHLPVMLSATTSVSYGAAVASVDFTLPTTQVYDNDARKNVSGMMVLRAGDVSFNETVGYTGAGNDRDPILTRVGSTTPNNSVSGYWREDVNMDGLVKYTGSANDRDPILVNVGSTTPNNTRGATLP